MKTFKLAIFLGIALMPLLRGEDNAETPLADDDPKAIALCQACEKGDLSEVKNLVGSGAPLNGQVGAYQYTPLIVSMDDSHLDVVKYLIASGVNLNFPDLQGSTALLHACWDNRTECALALIDAGANVNLGSHARRTPLMYAANQGNDRIVTALIAHGVNVNANSNAGPALAWAVSADHLSTVKLLGAAGANPNLNPVVKAKGRSHVNPILGDAAADNDLEMIDYLLGLKANVNSAGPDGATPLMVAAGWKNSEAIAHLLDHGANIELKDEEGQTALMHACAQGDMNCIQLLLDRKADVNATDLQGETALTIAGDVGQMDMVELLKSRGAQRTDIHIIAKPGPSESLSPAESWALAVGAIYPQHNDGDPRVLGYGDSGQESRGMLARDWNITDKITFLKEVDALSTKGHRSSYQEEGSKLAALSDQDFERLVTDASLAAGRARALRNSYLKWKGKSGQAWDLCRCANVISAGYAARYIDEDEAWDLLLYNARQAQAGFTSWQEMSDNFLDGREIWADKRDPRFEACAQLLLNPKDPNSPWNQNPWKTDLSNN